MATALSEIMRQATRLSANERLELAAQLLAANGSVQGESAEENAEGLDVFSLRYMPPEDSFVVQMRFVEAGEGEPARHDFER
jgi:hypothetical protein